MVHLKRADRVTSETSVTEQLPQLPLLCSNDSRVLEDAKEASLVCAALVTKFGHQSAGAWRFEHWHRQRRRVPARQADVGPDIRNDLSRCNIYRLFDPAENERAPFASGMAVRIYLIRPGDCNVRDLTLGHNIVAVPVPYPKPHGRLGPNVEGNRRADEMLAEDQAVCRRVRLTVRLGVGYGSVDSFVAIS